MSEILEAVKKVENTFEEYKKENDQALAEIKKLGFERSEVKEKLEKFDAALQESVDLKATVEALEAKMNKPGAGSAGAESKEHSEAYDLWARKGRGEDNLRSIEQKAMSVGTNADGGFAVPEILDRAISDRLVEISPMRAISKVVSVSTDDYKMLVNVKGMASGWVGETAARPVTDTPTLQEIAAVMGEIYANPAVTQKALDDVFFNVESFMSSEIAEEFAYQENIGFITGDGTNKPKGLLDYTTVATADGARTFGQIEHMATGVAGDFAATNKGDILIDLISKLKAGYRSGSRFILNRRTLAEIRKFKDTTGQYLWQPGLSEGNANSIAGYPYTEVEGLPDIAADSLSVGFGNFSRAYCVVDRIGTRQLRDPYTNKPYVHFYTTKRVGGMLIDDEAVKLLKFSA